MWRYIKRVVRHLLDFIRGREEQDEDVFYINGPDTLPLPLSHEEEAAAIDRLGYDEEAKTLLVEHNLRLVGYNITIHFIGR